MAQKMDLTDEARARISAANKGKPKSPEHRAKLSAALKGRSLSEDTRAKMSAVRKGKLVGGDDVRYRAAHERHMEVLPYECAHCGSTEPRLHCALKKGTPPSRLRADQHGVHAGLLFSLRSEDYIRLCVSCHRIYDKVRPAWLSK